MERPIVFDLRKLANENLNSKFLDLPIVVSGEFDIVEQYANKNGLTFVRDLQTLFGGYYRDVDGNCYYLT